MRTKVLKMLTKDYHTRCAIATFLVLRPAQLDHVLRRWMSNVNFTEYGISVVCKPEERLED